eukprot:TRINITY_DN92777_c0_g1_i1.p2 TRINITY_DN92777_c0_g1~~TRINITY_DN92777_c0_g1_i1.p2  ORF type:complete len:103 (-),score=17.63 TRINITY_DN92777_c0_g1_i1:9-275(-)
MIEAAGDEFDGAEAGIVEIAIDEAAGAEFQLADLEVLQVVAIETFALDGCCRVDGLFQCPHAFGLRNGARLSVSSGIRQCHIADKDLR